MQSFSANSSQSGPSHLLPSLFEAPPDDFVIALHDYTAPPSSRTHIYLSFQVGCRIRVWNRDESGWWDGEVVNDPEGREADATYGEQYGKTGDGRGWFPSNFVEEEGPDSRHLRDPRRASEMSMRSYRSGTSTSSSSLSESRRNSGQPSTSTSTSKRPTGNHMAHWREAPRPNQHAVTHSEPIVNPQHHRHHRSQGYSSQQIRPQHHHSSSSYSGKKNLGAVDWKTEAEITITLEPINQAMGLIRSAVGSRKISHLQPSTACAISAIRSLLLATDCLSRESKLLAGFPVLAKIRKTILANLAELVALARSASQPYTPRLGAEQTHGDDGMEEFKEAELEGMLKSSEETLENVRVFLKALVRCGIDLPERKDAEGSRGEPVGDRTSSGNLAVQGGQQQHARGNSSPGETIPIERTRQSLGASGASLSMTSSIDKERRVNLQAKSMSDLKISTRGLRSGSTDQGRDLRYQYQQTASPVSSRMEVGLEEVSAGSGSDSKRTRSRLGPDAGSISSVSSMGSSNDYQPTVHRRVASNEVRQPALETVDIIVGIGMTFDSLLSVTAALIGHVQCHTVASHPSSHALLVDLSRETIDKIRDLLAIVELVVNHQPTARNHGREVVALDQAKRQMYETTSALVEAAERVASTPYKEGPGEDDEMNKERLLSSASIIMRPARECVRLVKICGNRREAMETLGLGIRIDSGGANQSRMEIRDRSAEFELEGERCRRDSDERSSHASSRSSASRQSREESSGSESGAGHSSLLEAYVQDFSGPRSAPLDRTYRVPQDDEQEIMMTPAEQAARNRPVRPSLASVHSSPLLQTPAEFGGGSSNPLATPSGPRRRGRASSFTSPGHTPRLGHERSPRPPSKSVDLGGATPSDLSFLNTPRPGEETFTRRPSIPESIGSEQGSVQATPRPPRWWSGPNQQQPPMPSFPTQDHQVISRDARFEDALTPQKKEPAPKEVTPADMRMFLVSHDYNPKDIAYNPDGALIGATLPVLVEKLTPHDGAVDPTLWETFFLTFRLFTDPKTLLEAIEARFDVTPPVRMPLQPETVRIWNEMKVAPIRRQLLGLVKSWLSTYWDPAADNCIAEPMRLFLEDRIAKAFPVEYPRLLDLLDKHSRADLPGSSPVARVRQLRSGSSASIIGTPYHHRPSFSMSSSSSALPPTPIMNKQLFSSLKSGSSHIHVTDFHALELARQLTLLESKLFCAIDPQELIRLGKPRADSLKTMSTLSTRIFGWVMDRILEETDLKRRTALLKYFIKLSNRCLDLQNFSTLFAILGALNSSTIVRLKRTWDGLPAKYRNIMDDLRSLVEHTKNFQVYRTRLRMAEGPVLPFLGQVLSDITFTAEGNPSTRPSPMDPNIKLINFDRQVKLAKIVTEFARYQQPFNLAILQDVQNWLTGVLAEKGSASIDALYRKSLMLEPRQGTESISHSILDRPAWLGGRI